MNHLLVSGLVASTLFAFGCASNASSGLVDSCAGSYSCTDGTQTVSTELQKSDGACTAGQVTLNADGTVSGIDNATWDGDSQQFEVCSDGSCLTCTSTSGGSHIASCTGKAVSCGNHDPIGCELHPGCFWDSQMNYDGTFSPICNGLPDSCASRDGANCSADDGCTWQ